MKKLLLSASLLVGSISVMQSQITNWSAMGTGLVAGSGQVCFCNYNGSIYAGGLFSSAGGVTVANIAKWDGTSWSSTGVGTTGSPAANVADMIVYKNELYACGNFSTMNGVASEGVVKFNGTTWSSVGAVVNANGSKYDMEIMNDTLYLTGGFNSIGGVSANRIAKWDGTNWTSIGSEPSIGGDRFKLTVYNNKLYQCGSTGVAKFISGTTWTAVATTDNKVRTMIPHNGDLYVAGDFTTISAVSATRIAKYNGTTWSAVGVGADARVYALDTMNNKLYVGGSFTTVNTTSVNNVARYDAGTGVFSAMNNGMSLNVQNLNNIGGTLYASGAFTLAGTTPANYVAFWGNGSISGLKENQSFEDLTIYPNPTTGILKIDLKNNHSSNTVLIYNALMQKCLEKELTNGEISLEELPTGLYFVELRSKNGIKTQKVLKQ